MYRIHPRKDAPFLAPNRALKEEVSQQIDASSTQVANSTDFTQMRWPWLVLCLRFWVTQLCYSVTELRSTRQHAKTVGGWVYKGATFSRVNTVWIKPRSPDLLGESPESRGAISHLMCSSSTSCVRGRSSAVPALCFERGFDFLVQSFHFFTLTSPSPCVLCSHPRQNVCVRRYVAVFISIDSLTVKLMQMTTNWWKHFQCFTKYTRKFSNSKTERSYSSPATKNNH